LPGEIRNYKQVVSPPELSKYYVDDLLDPNRMGWQVLEGLEEDLGQYGFAGQIGQKPSPPSGGMFKVDQFQIVDQMPQSHEIQEIVRYWDKAGTEVKPGSNKKAAYTVGVKMMKLKNGKFLITHVVRGQWSTETRENKIRAT